MFGIIRRLAAEWRRIPFYDVIGNMDGSNKHWRQRQFEPTQEKIALKKMINGNVSSKLIVLWFGECVRRTVTLQDVTLLNVTSGRPYATAKKAIWFREYFG